MELYELTATEAVKAMRAKKIKALELMESVLSKLNKTGASIRAFINTIPPEKAVQEARIIDKKIEDGETLPPLAGVPSALKDNFCWEGIPTTCASKALEDFVPPYISHAAEKLAGAGAIIIGKTNLDEFAMGSTTENSFFYPSLNPWNLSRLAGDGAAAAVASGQCLLALGSDTGGSVRESASFCGVYGLRPTPGRVSRYGMVNFSSSLAQAGILARSPEDIVLALQSISGFDPRDSSTSAFCGTRESKKIPGSLTAGIPEGLFETLVEKHRDFHSRAHKVLKETGIELKEISLPNFAYALPAYYIIACAESSSNMSRFDGIRYGYNFDGSDLDEWYYKTREASFGKESRRRSILGTYLLSKGNFDRYYQKALRVWTLVREDFKRALKECDLIVLPVTRTGPLPAGENMSFLDSYKIDEFCAPVSMSGLPSLSLPAGEMDGLPMGLQLVGPAFSEEMLLELASSVAKKFPLTLNKAI